MRDNTILFVLLCMLGILLISYSWYFGDDDKAEPVWTQLTAHAEWSGRMGFSSVILPDGSIVLMGGYDGSRHKNDVWRSADNGTTWTLMTAHASWSGRYCHSSVALPDGSIVLIGGYDCTGTEKKDVWRSEDKGATWVQMTARANWSARCYHATGVLPDGSIILMGGDVGGGRNTNDVWCSSDNGATWSLVTAYAGWSARKAHSINVMPDGSIILMGGYTGTAMNDVWKSLDGGVTWTQVSQAPGWSGRICHRSVVMPDGSIILIGGFDGNNMTDVWRYVNKGTTWTQIASDTEWNGRSYHATVVTTDGCIILMGGQNSSGYHNDVWRFKPHAGSPA